VGRADDLLSQKPSIRLKGENEMVNRILDDLSGAEEACELKDIKKGDLFYTIDNGHAGPYAVAAADAIQKPSSRDKSKLLWHVAIDQSAMF
jgi:hypothetical protein